MISAESGVRCTVWRWDSSAGCNTGTLLLPRWWWSPPPILWSTFCRRSLSPRSCCSLICRARAASRCRTLQFHRFCKRPRRCPWSPLFLRDFKGSSYLSGRYGKWSRHCSWHWCFRDCGRCWAGCKTRRWRLNVCDDILGVSSCSRLYVPKEMVSVTVFYVSVLRKLSR